MIQIWKQRCTRIIWRTKNPDYARISDADLAQFLSQHPVRHGSTTLTTLTTLSMFSSRRAQYPGSEARLDMTWPCLKHFKTVYVGLSWSTLLEHGIVWIVTIVTSLCHLSLGIARSRCKLAGCSWSSKQQISQILSCSQMVFHTVMDVMANIVKHLCFVHVPSWMPLLDFWYFCTWCLQHLTVPLRVWGPAQTAAASTSDASTSTSYGRLGPYRQSTCDILRPFVTFCDHLWPLRKKRWLFSDYSVTIYMMTIYDYLVNLVTTLRFRMFHMFHAIDDQSADNVKVTSSKGESDESAAQWHCICCAA